MGKIHLKWDLDLRVDSVCFGVGKHPASASTCLEPEEDLKLKKKYTLMDLYELFQTTKLT